MENIKFLDVVKWNNPMSKPEKADVMVVEDIDGEALTVRHINTEDKSLSNIFSRDIHVVGRCTPYEQIDDIVARYINK